MTDRRDSKQVNRTWSWPRTVRTTCLLVASPIIALLLAEITLRLAFGLGDPPLYVVHPTIEYVLKPGSYRRFGNRITVNSAGMRSPERAIEPLRAGERRILVIGDSIVNGGSLTDDEDLATTILTRVFSRTSVATVCNISAGSWGPGNWLAFLRERGTFAASHAVIILNDGDFADAPTFAPLGPERPTERPTFACWEAASNYLPRYLPFLRRTASATDPGAHPASSPTDDLAAGIELLRMSGVAVSAVVVPSESELSAGPGRGLLGITVVLERLGVPCVSTEVPLKQAVRHGEVPFRDGVHLSVAGQAILAESCVEALRLSGLGVPPP